MWWALVSAHSTRSPTPGGSPGLCFDGPAAPAVLAAWEQRLDRMVALQRYCGEEFGRVRDEFLAALSSSEHRTDATVHVCLAAKPLA